MLSLGVEARFGVPLRRGVRGKDDLVCFQSMSEAGQWHVASSIQRVEKGFKLGLVRMVRDIARIEQIHGKLAPLVFVETSELGRVKFIVQQTPFAPHQMHMKIVRLEAIDYRC